MHCIHNMCMVSYIIHKIWQILLDMCTHLKVDSEMQCYH